MHGSNQLGGHNKFVDMLPIEMFDQVNQANTGGIFLIGIV